MTATALRGNSIQTGTWAESPASRSDIRSEEADRRALLQEWAEWAHEQLSLSPSKARRLVRYYANHITGDFSDFESWVIRYLDPTGETAVRNVMRERSA